MPLAVSVQIKLVDQLSKGLGKINNNLEKLGRTSDKSTRKLAMMGKTLDKIGSRSKAFGRTMSIGVTLPILAIGAASLKAAVDAEETLNKFNVVFSGVSRSANDMSNELAESFGLSRNESKELLSDTGDLLTGFGFTQKSALALSGQVQKLAVDLASFTNFSGGAEGASKALTKALLGERESIKSLGIAILEEDVKAKIKALEVAGKFTNETERERKAIATLAIAVEQSKNAIGDFARSQESTANQTRILLARLNDLSVELGTILLPIANKLVKGLIKVTNMFVKLPKGVKTTLVVLAALAAVIGPMVFVLGSMASGLGALITVLPVLSAVLFGSVIPAIVGMATALFATGIPQIIIGITLLIAAIVFLSKNFQKIKSVIIGAFKPILGFVDRFIERLTEISPILGFIAKAIRDSIVMQIKFAIGALDFLTEKFNQFLDAVNPFGGDDESSSAGKGAASGGVASIADAASPPGDSNTDVQIGIEMASDGQITGTNIKSSGKSRVRVLDTGLITPSPAFR